VLKTLTVKDGPRLPTKIFSIKLSRPVSIKIYEEPKNRKGAIIINDLSVLFRVAEIQGDLGDPFDENGKLQLRHGSRLIKLGYGCQFPKWVSLFKKGQKIDNPYRIEFLFFACPVF